VSDTGSGHGPEYTGRNTAGTRSHQNPLTGINIFEVFTVHLKILHVYASNPSNLVILCHFGIIVKHPGISTKASMATILALDDMNKEG
jgi:hypothetical protein